MFRAGMSHFKIPLHNFRSTDQQIRTHLSLKAAAFFDGKETILLNCIQTKKCVLDFSCLGAFQNIVCCCARDLSVAQSRYKFFCVNHRLAEVSLLAFVSLGHNLSWSYNINIISPWDGRDILHLRWLLSRVPQKVIRVGHGRETCGRQHRRTSFLGFQ